MEIAFFDGLCIVFIDLLAAFGGITLGIIACDYFFNRRDMEG